MTIAVSSYPGKYTAARKQARRFMSEHPGDEGFLPLLSEALGDARPAGEYELGLFEVPLKKVIGTCTAGRRAAFAGNFMPLWHPISEPASKWMHVYQAHEEEGLREPIKAYEYLGYHYVQEGHKRVSVLKASGAYSVLAEVIRVLPTWNEEDSDVAVLYEYYRHERRLPVRDMWFSRPGRLTALFEMAEQAAGDRVRGDQMLRNCFAHFRRVYHENEYGTWPMTTGDAFFSYVQVFGMDEQISARTMKGNMAACALQWHHELALEGLTPPAAKEEHRIILPYIAKIQPLTLAFAFEGTPETNELTRLHSIAQHKLSVLRPDVVVKTCEDLPPDDSAWPEFERLLSGRPHYLFASSPAHARLVWRAGLLHPETIAMHMGPGYRPERRMVTCAGRTREPAFLAGALAGMLTATNCIAVVTSPDSWEMRPAVFAAGAALTNPNARIFWYDGPSVPWHRIKAAFAVCKTDIAWLPARADKKLTQRLFPGVYACLCALSAANASPSEMWAAAAWHWHVFYMALTADPPAVVHENGCPAMRLRPGLNTGLMQFHQYDALLTPGTRQLMQFIRQGVISGELETPDEMPGNLSKVEL